MLALAHSPRGISSLHGTEHARFHLWWLQAFSNSNVRSWRPTRIRPVVHKMIDRFAERGRAELVEEFTRTVPMRVTASVLGLPWEDDEWLESCMAYMRARSEYAEAHARRADDLEAIGRRTIAVAGEFVETLRPFAERGRDGDGDDIISMFWKDGPSILPDWSVDDVLAGMITAFFAGSDTTAAAAANGIYLLLTQPELQDELRAKGTDLVERFVEEALRIYSVGHFVERFANEDTDVWGVEVKKDELVIAILAAANRDARRYERPADVDLERQNPRDHMAFAMGPRSCGGMWLARGDLAEMYTGLLERLSDLRLDPEAEPPRLQGFSVRRYKPLNVLFSAVT
jgi:cytochrome P450